MRTIRQIRALTGWIWIEPLVEAAITRRILAFYDALEERGQIPKRPNLSGPISTAITDHYTGSCDPSVNPSPNLGEPDGHPQLQPQRRA
jgi:hypothetical protein